MKAFITPSYTFTPGISGVGTVDLSGISSFDKKRLIAIINQTAGVVIYSTGSETVKYTDVTGSIVTLFLDTSAMNASDVLQVVYEMPDSFATEAKQDALNAVDFATSTKQDAEAVLIGAAAETAPASDTASSGLNGRLQRIAQRITSLIALIPVSLGQKTMANSLAVTLASDQTALPTSSTPQTVSGTVTSAKVTVGTSVVRATVSGSAPNATRKKLLIKPSTSNSGKIYLGASGVTTANGLEIIGPDRLEFSLDASEYYLISDTAAQSVEIVEVA
jgi:hypothetical protein